MKRSSQILAVLTSTMLILPNLCRADELEKIVITSSRVEESYENAMRKVDVITSNDIESLSASDLAEVLTKITSMNISSYGGLGATKSIRMRGSTASQVLVLIDGRPINNPRDGEADLSNIPLDNIERIEILHGPASSLYGSQAMGGTINIITKKPPKEKQKTELATSFGTFRTYTEKLLYGGNLSNFGYLITGQYESSEGFRDNSEFNTKDFNTKFEYELNDQNNLSLNFGFYKARLGTPGTISSPDNDDKQNSLKNFVDLNWNFKPDDTTQFSVKIYNNYDRLEFIENTAGSAFDVAFSKAIHATKVRGLDFLFNKQLFEKYQLITGFNLVKNMNNSTSSAKHKYTVRAGYVENQLNLSKRLKVNLGARVDDYSNFGTEFNPSAGFLYVFRKQFKLRGLISRSFRAPTFNDLYWPDEGWAKGNPNVKPEKGITAELGIETQVNKYLQTGITYYRNDYNGLINWAPDAAGVWQPSNIDSAVIDGIEWENKIFVINNLEIDLGYTFLNAKNDETHNYLIYQPKHKLDFSLKYKNINGILFELRGQLTDKRFHDSANTIKVERFLTLSLNASKKFSSGFTYFISIDNLLNKEYQIIRDYPMPGFSFTSGIKLEF